MPTKFGTLAVKPWFLLLILIGSILIVYWLIYGRSWNTRRYLIEGFDETPPGKGMTSADSNQATKQVEQLLRNFENNYRIFQEDNQRLSALTINGINATDHTNVLNYLDEVTLRNNNFLSDLQKIRALENDITKSYGSPLFASILEKVTAAEKIISDSTVKITLIQKRIIALPTTPPAPPVVVAPPVAIVTAPAPAPAAVVTAPAAPVAAVVTAPAPVAAVVTAPVQAPVAAVVTAPVQAPVAAVVTAPVQAPAPAPAPVRAPVAAVVTTDDSDIRAAVVTTAPVGVVNSGWPNQIPILVPGQIVSQIPNPIVPSRFNNFAAESQALTAAASTMGAVAVRPDRINCMSSMQYYSPISSPGYPPPQPVFSGSY